jgi:hypothetical protein
LSVSLCVFRAPLHGTVICNLATPVRYKFVIGRNAPARHRLSSPRPSPSSATVATPNPSCTAGVESSTNYYQQRVSVSLLHQCYHLHCCVGMSVWRTDMVRNTLSVSLPCSVLGLWQYFDAEVMGFKPCHCSYF